MTRALAELEINTKKTIGDRKLKSVKSIFVIVLATYLLTGCAATGTKFVSVEPAPEDKGVVYFYRPKAFVGSAANLMLVDNGEQLGRIQNGQFIKYIAEPGDHSFHTDTMAIDKAVEFKVEAGKNYYVRTALRQGMWTSTWYLSRVFEQEALQELRSCCKSGDKK